jgi:hypothetical protein
MKIIENPTWQIKNTNSVFIAGLQFIFSIESGENDYGTIAGFHL